MAAYAVAAREFLLSRSRQKVQNCPRGDACGVVEEMVYVKLTRSVPELGGLPEHGYMLAPALASLATSSGLGRGSRAGRSKLAGERVR